MKMMLRNLLPVLVFLSVSAAGSNEQDSTASSQETRQFEEATEDGNTANSVDKSDPGWKQNLKQPSLMSFEEGKTYFWDMQTNKGDMSFRLFHESAPMHTTSTIYLTTIGFYDDLTFHRVIPGFMAQGGDPTGTGGGGPGYSYDGEFDGTTRHSRPGLLSMANAGPKTDGSQFFITFVPAYSLDGKHTIFGEMVSGKDTLRALEKQGSRSGRVRQELVINKATIRVE